jgi:hypothetical protein
MNVWTQIFLCGAGIVHVVCIAIFIAKIWYKWYPRIKQKLDPAIGRALFVVLNGIAGVYAHILARHYINTLTGVDPNNFPTVLLTFTGIAFLCAWLYLIAIGAVFFFTWYLMWVMYIRSTGQRVWNEIRVLLVLIGLLAPKREPKRYIALQQRRDSMRHHAVNVFGSVGIAFLCSLPPYIASQTPFDRWVKMVASTVLVLSEFSYDRTCAVSSEERLVAPLKERKDGKGERASRVIIADLRSVKDVRFLICTCEEGAVILPPGTETPLRCK